ncbi:hypothetical protein ACFL08_02400 [Patescibacteria group bacterium]
MTVIRVKDRAKEKLFGPTYSPIINTLLEVDRYKFSMLPISMAHYDFFDVTFALKNRTTSVRLADEVDLSELRSQLGRVHNLQITPEECDYLVKSDVFPEDRSLDLMSIRLVEPEINETHDGQIDVRVSGRWKDVMLWETSVLTIINQLRTKGYVERHGIDCRELIRKAEERFLAKIPTLKKLTWSINQFGLRRRATAYMERRLTQIAKNEIPEILKAVSNVQVARELGVSSGGTIAHEISMILYALRLWEGEDQARDSQYETVRRMIQYYPYPNRLILPDAFGSNQFINGMPEQMAIDTAGFRQDSGDPIEFGEMVIAMYKRFGIDPMTKRCVFSDGLTPEKMLEINQYFEGRIQGGFGWGTNMTNDTGIIKPLSLVMKPVRAADKDVVKLSDNVDKATGPRAAIEMAKRVFGYNVTYSKKCIY